MIKDQFPEYPYSREFQRRILAAYVRSPRLVGIVEPRYFSNHAIRLDIARIASDLYAEHANEPLSKIVLLEAVRGFLGKKRRELWPSYRKEVRGLYKGKIPNESILVEEARLFAKEAKYREALVRGEEDLNNLRFENIDKRFEELRDLQLTRKGQPAPKRWKDIPVASKAPPENLEWLAEGRIPAKQVTVIAAQKDCHKSMLMLALIRAATTKGDFLGRPTKQVRCLYQNRDMPKAVFDKYCRTLGLNKKNPRFKILSSLWDTKFQPMQPDHPVLLRFARRYKPLIIFDHFMKFYTGDTGDPKAIDAFMEKLKQLTARGATVVLLHHQPKHDAKSEGYGSVYIINGADFGWAIRKEGDLYASEQHTTLRITNTKTKMEDYCHLLLRPQLALRRDYKILGAKSEGQAQWDKDLKRVLSFFSSKAFSERRKARKEAKEAGIPRRRFMQLYDFALGRGLLLEKRGEANIALAKRVRP